MNKDINYTTTAASALTAMLNKIAGLVVSSESEDPDYYDGLSCTAMMLANGIKMLKQNNNIYSEQVQDEAFEPCDGDCDNCEMDCSSDEE